MQCMLSTHLHSVSGVDKCSLGKNGTFWTYLIKIYKMLYMFIKVIQMVSVSLYNTSCLLLLLSSSFTCIFIFVLFSP